MDGWITENTEWTFRGVKKKACAVTFSDDGIKWCEPVITLEKNLKTGWEDDINRNCVIKVDGMYKMWYSAGETHEPNVNAYAVSTDGINWKKAKCNPIFVCDKANEYEQNRIGGCKVNQYETEAMTELYASAGYEIVPFESKADIYIL